MTEDHGRANALAWFQLIVEMVDTLRLHQKRIGMRFFSGRNPQELEDAEHAIYDSVLSVEVRSGWVSAGSSRDQIVPVEFCILLSTGGPALRLVGGLNEHGEPEEDGICLEYQDWGTPWTRLHMGDVPTVPSSSYEEVLHTFAQQFYFGEG